MSKDFVINVIIWLLWTVGTIYFEVVEPVFYIYSIFPSKVRNSLCQDLLPGRWSTVTKSSLGSISGATVLISSHPAMCKTQCQSGSAGGEYKPTPTQYLLNVWPALPVLAVIHSTLGPLSYSPLHAGCTTGTMLWPKAVLMLARRLRRCPHSAWRQTQHGNPIMG